MKTWVKFGLFWGIIMFLGMVILFPLLQDQDITFNRILLGIIIFPVAGLILGYLTKKGI